MFRVIIILVLFSQNLMAQEVEIFGYAIDSTKGRKPVTVIINDTLNKLLNSDMDEKYRKVINENKLIVYTEKDGTFKIRARVTDSLYFSSWRHFSQAHKVSDLLAKKEIKVVLEPKPCVTYVECDDPNPILYVFIGEKISVESAPDIEYCNVMSMDSKYQARYKILENIYGDFKNDTIDFVSYDHASYIRYDDFDHVLLYVANYCGELINVKYQFDPLYKTKNGRWASPYKSYKSKTNSKLSAIKPHKIRFPKELKFDFSPEPYFTERYPSPFYKIVDKKAIPKYGFYPNELFEIKKNTVLKERGFFK
jgi:hypothetical protein